MFYIQPLSDQGSDRLDETDLALIRLLQVNGRAPFVQLAKELNLPEKLVRRKVMQLISDKVIQIAPVCNPSILGLCSIAMVAVRLKGAANVDAFISELLVHGCVDYAAVALGRFDLLVEMLAEDDHRMRELIQAHIRNHPDVETVNVHPYIGLCYQQPVWDNALEKYGSRSGLFATDDKVLDLVDRQIIASLSLDGRMPFLRIGEEIGISEGYIRKRFAALMARGDFGVHALTNPQSLGYKINCWIFFKIESGHSLTAVSHELSKMEHVAYVALSTGRADLLVEVICRNKDELRYIIGERLSAIAGAQILETHLCTKLFYRSVEYAFDTPISRQARDKRRLQLGPMEVAADED